MVLSPLARERIYKVAPTEPHNLRSFIATYIHLYAFIHSCFCNLSKSLARCCVHIFLAAGCADLGGDITNNNGRLISGKCDRCGSWFSLSILADDTLHEGFLLVFISGFYLSRVGSYTVITITLSGATLISVRRRLVPQLTLPLVAPPLPDIAGASLNRAGLVVVRPLVHQRYI